VKIESALYKPFGEQSEWLLPGNAAPETKGWIGERYDADAGLQYLNARYYDPERSLFLQPDWFEVTKAGVGTNRFSYSFNDPVNKSDPLGNDCDIMGACSLPGDYIPGFDDFNPIAQPGTTAAMAAITLAPIAVIAAPEIVAACGTSQTCTSVARAYLAAETTMDVTGCASGDIGSCAAAAVPGVTGVGANAAEPTLKGVLEGSKEDDGFTGVIDSRTGKILLQSSANPPGPGQVPRTGCHAIVSDSLGGNRADHQGFAVIVREDGTLRVTWSSGTLNKAENDFEIPEADRKSIVEKIEKETEREVSEW
jgi:RHS repeat-associated protein